ncbi:CopD family protein [Cytobacillus spongiae]|uniref:CopD family protein n=1 Tax=Cytobacillus spongiae TaxID=2901381 RepID=UPI001F415F2C|nr:CopD family protein [Cytobacillus spongiae]UII56142.1 CopD family protein [Cytobacillus spongiae]
MMVATGGIAVFSFVPLASVVHYFYQDRGLLPTLQSVLFTFEVGKSWLFTYIVATFLFIYLVWVDYRRKPLYAWFGIFITFMLIVALGWSSHASSLDQWKGLMAHTAHFTAVTVWVGVLLMVSWFSRTYSNWLLFLQWFRPVAIVSFGVTVLTGLVLMSLVVDFNEYPNTWSISYGQTLLFKHILIIPLMAYAFINSFLIQKRLVKDSSYNPKPWAQAESIVILLIFSITAALGQQSPPHDLAVTIKSEGATKLFSLIYRGSIVPELSVQFAINSISLSFFGLSLVCLVSILLSFVKRASVAVTYLMILLFVLTGYLGLVLSLQ